jgi:hypothetical protein
MRRKLASVSPGVAAAILCVAAAGGAYAGPATETLFYTTFAGGENVWKTTATYTGNGSAGNGTFTVAAGTGIAATPGADGLVFNPNNGFLLVGGQGNSIAQVNPSNGSFTTAAPRINAYELTVDPNEQVVWSGGSEGGDNRISSTPITRLVHPEPRLLSAVRLAPSPISPSHLACRPELRITPRPMMAGAPTISARSI